MAINIGKNSDGDVTYKNPPVDRTLFPNITEYSTPEEIEAFVNAWLDDHPEATTTVEDGSILPVKLDSTNSASDGYVLSYNATAGKFEWYDIGGELDEINSDITDLKQDLEGLDVYTLGLYPQMSVADTAVASFTDGADNIPVKSLTVDITPVQSGTGDPSPENVRPISGWTGANISVFDVNVWDEEYETGGLDVNTGEIQTDNTKARSKNYIPCLGDTTYYIKTPNPATYFVFYDANKNFIGNNVQTQSRTFQTPAGCRYMKFRIGDNSNPPASTYNHDISINYPSTDHDYHAYKGGVYSVDWTTEAGTVYGGTLDVTSGVLTVGKVKVDLGSMTWGKIADGRFSTDGIRSTVYSYASSEQPDMASNWYKTVTYNESWAANYNMFVQSTGYLYVRNDSYTDAATFKAAMAENNVYVVYKLATPVTYQLTPTEVATILGQNNIFCDTGDIVELTYRADLKAYIDEKLA